MAARDDIARILAAVGQEKFGLEPFNPDKNWPQDFGLGGPSSEYVATDTDANGQIINYPQIWWDQQGNGYLLPPQQAMDQAAAYEQNTGNMFPRFPNLTAADFAAQNRSLMGGGQSGVPLASIFGINSK